MDPQFSFISVAFCFAVSCPAWAESWNCEANSPEANASVAPTLKIEGNELKWIVQGDDLPGLMKIPDMIEPFVILTNNKLGIVAVNSRAYKDKDIERPVIA